MRTLRTQIDSIAATFANSIIEAIKGSSLQDLVSSTTEETPETPKTTVAAPRESKRQSVSPPPPAATGKRLKRRSEKEIAQALGEVVLLVKKHKDGMRAEEIRANLGMEAKELPRVLKEGLESKKLRKQGQKRATVYLV